MLSATETAIIELLRARGRMYGRDIEAALAAQGIRVWAIYFTLGRLEERGWIEGNTPTATPADPYPRRTYVATGKREPIPDGGFSLA